MLPPTPHPSSSAPADAGQALWLACTNALAQDLPEPQFNIWIKPLVAQVAADFSRVTVFAANRFKLDWIRTQFAGRIADTLERLHGQPVHLELAITPRISPTAKGNSETKPVPADLAGTATTASLSAPELAPTEEAPASGFRNRLNGALTFETLVEGSANRMARAAALHVAGSPGKLYNPLFIYGGVGLGKTHLVHAVGNRLLQQRPDAKVLYIHAEQFVSDVVKAYQRKTFEQFKDKYHSLDLLLIDDVQFFANKERTQEEFFNAFEALLAKKSHIVMTSDTYPKGLTDIHERLISRFDAGLTVAIEPPELEMRVAILISKAESEGAEMPEEVAFFVAKNVRSNVRELEGALRKILAYSRFNQKDISIALAREALRDLLSIQNRQIGVENIQKTVADYYKIKVADMYSKKRPASIARPRQIAMYLAKELTQKSLPEIGELFGGRDHTTVLHAVRKIAGERQQNTELNQQLHVLEQTLKG
ncbi:chromosomal replication initiator protein DnaA [Comamonadaceae bacterium OH2545_COT-014]|nr:chromosomal replication initiator protein DnaA [Comamonadaceae bacterium OH2545_COT-014]